MGNEKRIINNMKRIFLYISIIIFFTSCKNNTETISNLSKGTYFIDYSNKYETGLLISNDSLMSFTINFADRDISDLYYKVYYQNESYKFPNTHEYSTENFYGSWIDTSVEFKKVTTSEINENIKIVGNPRDEQRYYNKTHETNPSQKDIEEIIKRIKASKEWYSNIKNKAQEKNVSEQEQLIEDAKWIFANSEDMHKTINIRSRRNPRVGKYSMLIVIINTKDLDTIPDYIKNISIKNIENKFVAPFGYFLTEKNKTNKNVILIEDFVTVKANLPIENGIYINYKQNEDTDTSSFTDLIGISDKLFKSAAFTQYKHQMNHYEVIKNIPVLANFQKDGYSNKEYEENVKKYDTKRIKVNITNSQSPGATIKLDKANNTIHFFNPPSSRDDYKKENVGIKTRDGMTYGKYTMKVKMANVLTKENVWTGLTNAIWLITESFEPWNNRRKCWVDEKGYKPYYGAGKDAQTVPEMSYSEIDFEIVKAAEEWPYTSYADKTVREAPESNKDKVMIACTNWDMSCRIPEKYDIGVKQIAHNKDTFNIHRWNYWYDALTSKTPEKNSELFGGEYYYFQLEWNPTEIIWRVGPEKDDLRVVGYMNDKVTSIPNNQMLLVLTQEFHLTEWWPLCPFSQENVPFSSEKMEGILYEMTIE